MLGSPRAYEHEMLDDPGVVKVDMGSFKQAKPYCSVSNTAFAKRILRHPYAIEPPKSYQPKLH